jgi:hypothetical protein
MSGVDVVSFFVILQIDQIDTIGKWALIYTKCSMEGTGTEIFLSTLFFGVCVLISYLCNADSLRLDD